MKRTTLAALGFFSVLLTIFLPAAEPASGEDRLRDALRQSMLLARTAQNSLAELQANQANLEQERKSFADKYDALRKQIVADKAGSDKAVAELKEQLAEQKATLAKRTETLEKTRTEGEKTAQAAQQAEAQVTKLTAETIALQRRLADREAKNLALFLLGNEILGRYEDFSLGNALKAKEPFVGLTRTKLENLVQDYEDKLLDQRLKP